MLSMMSSGGGAAGCGGSAAEPLGPPLADTGEGALSAPALLPPAAAGLSPGLSRPAELLLLVAELSETPKGEAGASTLGTCFAISTRALYAARCSASVLLPPRPWECREPVKGAAS